MRRYSANYIYPVTQRPIKNGIVEVDDDGTILRIIDPGNSVKEIHSTEFYNGVIVPGFINAHCHLELSHLYGKLPRNLGMAGFIRAVSEERNVDQNEIENSIKTAITEIGGTGTVAVADICNTAVTAPYKSESKIYFRNFIEVFGINASAAGTIIENALAVRAEFYRLGLTDTSLTPHAPYSLSGLLWEKLADQISRENSPISIHFAESLSEYEYLEKGEGSILERYKLLNVPFEKVTGLTPLQVVTNHVGKGSEVLFIHNTFALADELMALTRFYKKATFITCPESNLFIEGKLPDLGSMYRCGLNIAVGTDSLSSSSTLSMLFHLNIILDNFPEIPFAEVLKWATLNGAEALNASKTLGSIDIGKKPGLNLITSFNFNEMRPQNKSTVKRLI